MSGHADPWYDRLLMIGFWGLVLVIALILSPLMLVDWAERKWSTK